MATITVSKSSGATGSIRENLAFRRLLRASSVSMLGSHVTTIAYPLLVLRLTGSPFTAGCVAFAATAPSVLAYIPAGAIVDRSNPRRLMLLSEFGRGLAIATVALTLAFGKPILQLLIVVAVVEGVLEVFSGLAERRYMGSFVKRDEASSALVRMEARTHLVLVMGRPLGCLLFGIGQILPFLADVASFAYSVVTLTGISDMKAVGRKVASASPLRLTSDDSLISEIRQGLHWIRADKFARMAILSFSVGTLFFQALIMVFLGDAHNVHLSALVIGAILAASGVGGALGSAAASWLLARITYPWIRIQTLIWVAGFALLALPVGQRFYLMAIIMAILGFTGALGNIALDTHLMQNVDKQMLARVTSVGRLASFTACAIGPVFGGVLVQEIGVSRALPCLFFFAPVLLLLAALTPPTPRRQNNSLVKRVKSADRSSIVVWQSWRTAPVLASPRQLESRYPVHIDHGSFEIKIFIFFIPNESWGLFPAWAEVPARPAAVEGRRWVGLRALPAAGGPAMPPVRDIAAT